MTYADMYDEYLEELYREKVDKVDFLRGCHIGELCREHDQTMYNCGFNDWSDSLEGVKCSECDRKIPDDDARGASQDDAVLCAVCSGEEFECEVCGEVFAHKHRSGAEDLCVDCGKEVAAEDDNEEVDDPDEDEDPLDD